jgi:hypothetical protein
MAYSHDLLPREKPILSRVYFSPDREREVRSEREPDLIKPRGISYGINLIESSSFKERLGVDKGKE